MNKLMKNQVWKSRFYDGFYVIVLWDEGNSGTAGGLMIGNGEPTTLAYKYEHISQYYYLLAEDSIPLWVHAMIWGAASKWNDGHIPAPHTEEFRKMYEAWVNFAFAEFPE